MMQMWERAELKKRAKAVLKTSYWKAFLVALVLSFTGGGPNISTRFNFPFHSSEKYTYTDDTFSGNTISGNPFSGATFSENPLAALGRFLVQEHVLVSIIIAVMIIAVLLAVAFTAFLTSPLEVSSKKYYSSAALGEVNLGFLGFSFEKGRYLKVVKTMFFKNLYQFLWSLLLVIPGIVKSYSYRLVPYLLSDNPFLDTERAITLSRELMDGNKFRTFVLDLSFLGWYLLGMIPLGLGILFVNPYAFSTSAELYLVLQKYGLQNGICSYEELSLNRPEAGMRDLQIQNIEQ